MKMKIEVATSGNIKYSFLALPDIYSDRDSQVAQVVSVKRRFESIS